MSTSDPKQDDTPSLLNNADFLVWHVAKHHRRQREEEIKNIFYTRERVRPTHH